MNTIILFAVMVFVSPTTGLTVYANPPVDSVKECATLINEFRLGPVHASLSPQDDLYLAAARCEAHYER